MNNENNKHSNIGCLIAIIIFAVILIALLCSGGTESEYEKAGEEFESWIGDDPRTWSDTEKQYFNDFWEWADEH